MDKIEKFELLENFAEYLAEYHGKNELGFICSSRMIDEFLNQSQKQPEGEFDLRKKDIWFMVGGKRHIIIDGKEYQELPKTEQPEKQEEWREGFWEGLAPLSAMQELVGNNTPFEKVIDGVGREILLEQVSQLLSEREKELLEWVISEESVPQDIGSLWASLRWHEIYKEAHKRLSKLLKEEE